MVDCDVCHICRRRDHVARCPKVLREACRIQARDEAPFWPFLQPDRVVDPDDDDDVPPDTDECNYPPQPCFMELTAHHEPYVVDVVISVRRDRPAPKGEDNGPDDAAAPFFQTNMRNLKWKLDPFDGRTVILTRVAQDPPVTDHFTFKDRARAADWVFALDLWYVWEPL